MKKGVKGERLSLMRTGDLLVHAHPRWKSLPPCGCWWWNMNPFLTRDIAVNPGLLRNYANLK